MKKLLFLLSLLALQNFSMDWSENISDNLTVDNLKTFALAAIGTVVIYDRYRAWRAPKATTSGVNTSNLVTTQDLQGLVTKQELELVLAQVAQKDDLLIQDQPITDLFAKLVQNSVEQQETMQELVDLTGKNGIFQQIFDQLSKNHAALKAQLTALKTKHTTLFGGVRRMQADGQQKYDEVILPRLEALERLKTSENQEIERPIPAHLLDQGDSQSLPGSPITFRALSDSESESSSDDGVTPPSTPSSSPILIKRTLTDT